MNVNIIDSIIKYKYLDGKIVGEIIMDKEKRIEEELIDLKKELEDVKK